MTELLKKDKEPSVGHTIVAAAIVACLAMIAGKAWWSSTREYRSALYYKRACADAQQGKLRQALNDVTRAIHLRESPAAYSMRAKIYVDISQVDNALADLNRALQLDPHDPVKWNSRGFVLVRRGLPKEAIHDFNEAIYIKPRFDSAYANRGYAYSKCQRFPEAIKDLDYAIALNPEQWSYYNSLAWILSTCPDPKFRDGLRAIDLAKKACYLSQWRIWYCVGTLAASYAEVGSFEKAVQYQLRAIGMNGLSAKEQSEARLHLELYQRKMPYHQR